MTDRPAPARPSASVVVARDGEDGLEILLVRRNAKIVFHGGAWVFPGGRVDDGDALPDDDPLAVAKRAAVREAREETGLELAADGLQPFAHWTTPLELPKRFATWFFLATVGPDTRVQIDASEIVDYRWFSPRDALAARAAGAVELPGPTFVTLTGFEPHADCGTLTGFVEGGDVMHYVPRLVKLETGRCALYAEDAGYEALDVEAPGPRHRLVMARDRWDYVRDF